MILCGYEVVQDARYFPLTRDTVLLADFANAKKGSRVLDLGAGQGYLGILLQERFPCTVDALERDAGAAEAAVGNYRRCFCEGTVRTGDWSEEQCVEAGAYSLCVSNPPYFCAGSGPEGKQRNARQADAGAPKILCFAACRALQNGGRFCLCTPPDALTVWMCALTEAGLEPKRLRFVTRRPECAPALALLEAKKGGRPGLRVHPPLITETRSGAPTAELTGIYSGKAGK